MMSEQNLKLHPNVLFCEVEESVTVLHLERGIVSKLPLNFLAWVKELTQPRSLSAILGSFGKSQIEGAELIRKWVAENILVPTGDASVGLLQPAPVLSNHAITVLKASSSEMNPTQIFGIRVGFGLLGCSISC